MARKKLTGADCARIVIKVGGTALTLLYGYLQLSWKPIHDLTRSLPASVLLQLGLLLYFAAWAYGTSWDVDEQEAAFSPDAVKPLLAGKTYGAAAGMVVVFGVVCYFGTKPATWFIGGLLAFWIANGVAWHFFLRSEIERRIAESSAAFDAAGQYARAQALEHLRKHMLGTWQTVRFVAGGVVLIAMNALVWRGWVSVIGRRMDVAPDILFSLSIIAFVVVAEAPIWFSRVCARSAREALEDLEEGFGLVKKPPPPVASTGG